MTEERTAAAQGTEFREAWALYALAGLALFAGLAFSSPNNLDVAWYLVGARSLIESGGTLYVDIRDLNTPAVWSLFLFVQQLSDWLGQPAHRVFFVLLALVNLGCLAFACSLLPGGSEAGKLRRLGFFIGGALLLGFTAADDSGQRDLLAAVLCLPYIAWIQRLSEDAAEGSRGLGAAATLLLGLALLIKPPFVLYPLALELLLGLRLRSWWSLLRVDLLLPALITVALGVLLLLLHPAYLDYLGDYAAFYAGWAPEALTVRIWASIALLAVGVAFAHLVRRDPWAETLLVAGVAALLTSAVQNKWWDYHAYPIELFAALAWCAFLVHPRPWPSGGRPWLRTALIAFVSVWLVATLWGARGSFFNHHFGPALAGPRALAEEIDRRAQGAPVAMLGGYEPAIAVYLSRSTWALADPPFWVVLHLAGRDDLDEMERTVERLHLDEIAARLDSRRPLLIVFHRGDGASQPDAFAYYSAEPRIAALLDAYGSRSTFGDYLFLSAPQSP